MPGASTQQNPQQVERNIERLDKMIQTDHDRGNNDNLNTLNRSIGRGNGGFSIGDITNIAKDVSRNGERKDAAYQRELKVAEQIGWTKAELDAEREKILNHNGPGGPRPSPQDMAGPSRDSAAYDARPHQKGQLGEPTPAPGPINQPAPTTAPAPLPPLAATEASLNQRLNDALGASYEHDLMKQAQHGAGKLPHGSQVKLEKTVEESLGIKPDGVSVKVDPVPLGAQRNKLEGLTVSLYRDIKGPNGPEKELIAVVDLNTNGEPRISKLALDAQQFKQGDPIETIGHVYSAKPDKGRYDAISALDAKTRSEFAASTLLQKGVTDEIGQPQRNTEAALRADPYHARVMDDLKAVTKVPLDTPVGVSIEQRQAGADNYTAIVLKDLRTGKPVGEIQERNVPPQAPGQPAGLNFQIVEADKFK